MVREPFQRVPNGSSVNCSSADASQRVPEVQVAYGFGTASTDPSQSDEDCANTQHESRTDLVDQISFKRHKPGFKGDEQRNGPLDSDQRDMHMGLNRFGEKGPGVLQVRDG